MQGIGEKFSPNPQTGTGNFTIPITVPAGRNGVAPQLSLGYSSGSGNGPFGLGWNSSVPGVTRKTSKGTPLYNNAKDTFIISGAEDLVPIGQVGDATRYKPRTEGLFALIDHHIDHVTGLDYWEVKSKDGTTSIYGKPAAAGLEPAIIAHPVDRDNIFAWNLTQTTDAFGNKIIYEYERDMVQANGHHWDQLYLKRIRYIDYTDQATSTTKFLVSVTFVYETTDRPDAFSDYRAGFEIRTRKRCERIEVRVHEAQERLVRTYELIYLDRRVGMEQFVPLNRSSLLSKIVVRGHDGSLTEALPPTELSYTQFEPQKRKFVPLTGSQLPVNSIGNPDFELADLFGNGLPDVLQMNSSVRYWRNLGGGLFDRPREMDTAPAGIHLTDRGVQLLDANGDGRLDLLVTNEALSGYYPLQFGGLWNRRSFSRYDKAPSFDLKDPEVRLLDLDGDGVTDALRSGSRLECFFNDPDEGWKTTRQVERGQLSEFPNVNFSDQRVKLADMTGDGLQDIVLVSDGDLVYWPNLGRGDWGKRIRTTAAPSFPREYDPKRVLLGDVDGDGLADLIYVDDKKVTLWINQSGNGWSQPIVIRGTPAVTNSDGVRLADIFGSGVSGLLWSRDADGSSETTLHFLDFSGGVKPYLLNVMDNHTGATTRITYSSSTRFYLQDEQKPQTRWKTPLPFPVQVVSSVEVVDAISGGRLTTEYTYHHGYWDGVEREFRGFGRVDQRDTEVFINPTGSYSPPTETRTWFHLGPVDGAQLGEWTEANFSTEFWLGDAQLLQRPQTMEQDLALLPARAKRDAFRALRGQTLRTELYALDGTDKESRPYVVTQHLWGVCEVPTPTSSDPEKPRVFFPHVLTVRTTQWERGDDPQTTFAFTDDYDSLGQPRQQTAVALPRRSAKRNAALDETRILATHSRTSFATPDADLYMKDRPAHLNSFALATAPELTETQPNSVTQVLIDQKTAAQGLHTQFQTLLATWQPGQALPAQVRLLSHTINHYDGNSSQAFTGRTAGLVGPFGALTRSESLVFTDAELNTAYGNQRPSYLGGTSAPPAGAPAGFGGSLGYQRKQHSVAEGYQDGYYVDAQRQKFDFHDSTLAQARGLAIASQDALGHETRLTFDTYRLFPVEVLDAGGMKTIASHDYRVFQPNSITDPNGNRTDCTFTPLGLLATTSVRGKTASEGDQARASIRMTYDFLAFENSPATNRRPINVRTVRQVHHDTETDVLLPERDETIESVEFSDGFGRRLQTRTQGEDLRFGDPIFGGQVLPKDELPAGNDVTGVANTDPSQPNVVVSGWKIYDNKGRVVEQYEPFFSTGWDYAAAQQQQLGQKTTLFYDPRGKMIRTVNPDGSEQRVVYGVPGDLANPNVFAPSPWEMYTYDSNDNAGRTPVADPNASGYEHHWNTPNSVVIDALGRTIVAVGRNRAKRTAGNPLPPIEELRARSTYDIQGNLLTTTDPLGRIAFRYSYDLTKRPLRTESIDAGFKLVVVDALGNPVEKRDSKGAIILQTYDLLNRPARLWAQDGANQSFALREKLIYGDSPESGLSETQARALNTFGKLYRHFDEAGLTTFGAYDFKGNVLESARQVISDAAILSAFNSPPANWEIQPFRVNWESTASVLDATEYQITYTYDALNRPKKIVYPKDVDFATTGARKVLKPRYNRAGSLEHVELDGAVYVDRIAYNAKRQRAFISYGNGAITRYAYDEKTFRLVRQRTEKYTKPNTLTYRPAAPLLQDFVYTYDLAGNILSIKDRTPNSGIPNSVPGINKLDRIFTYDPLYRLLSASGRETNIQVTPPWSDAPRSQDVTSVRAYQQTYTYDAGNNMTRLRHESSPGAFNRDFAFVSGSNRIASVTDTGVTRAYTYDANGNLIRENTDRNFEWDHSDRMRVYRTQTPNSAPSLHTHYLYGAGGQRVKKLVRTAANDYVVTVYIDGIFEHHRRVKPNGAQENNTLHIMDDQSRIAMVRAGAAFPDDSAANVPVKYHLSDYLGSSNVVLDANGNLFNREEYAPYGESSFGSFAKKRYRFTGKERDEESGLYYHGARYYAPWLARWASSDPAGAVDGVNLFAYARLNPVRYSDPHGTASADQQAPKPAATPPVSAAPKEESHSLAAELGTDLVRSGCLGVRAGLDLFGLGAQQRMQDNVNSAVLMSQGKYAESMKVATGFYDYFKIFEQADSTGEGLAVSAGHYIGANDMVEAVTGDGDALERTGKVLSGLSRLTGAFLQLSLMTSSGPAPGTKLVSPVYRVAGRDFVVVETAAGRQAFYRSTGVNSGAQGKWFPFDEMLPGWLNKAEYTNGPGLEPGAPLHRLGTNEFARISKQLGEMSLPKGQEVPAGRFESVEATVNRLLDFFNARQTKSTVVRPLPENTSTTTSN
ncbi:MAG TPA: SpvB/TcaC N-terminal domain-containing protein [Pyrinomonadaceae bacterium]|nr:SpvB/TcaC N-terminal domain-containing protein [Pyrinomonadaceae bacterium]